MAYSTVHQCKQVGAPRLPVSVAVPHVIVIAVDVAVVVAIVIVDLRHLRST